MPTRPARDLAFVVLVGGFALSIVGASCGQEGPTNRNTGGSTSSGGVSNGGTTSSGGSSATGGTTSSGGSGSGGSSATGGTTSAGGSGSGGSSATGGSKDGGSGGSGQGGSGGSAEGGSGGAGDGGSGGAGDGGSGGTGDGGSGGAGDGGSGGAGDGGSGGSGDGGSGGAGDGGSGGSGDGGSGGSGDGGSGGSGDGGSGGSGDGGSGGGSGGSGDGGSGSGGSTSQGCQNPIVPANGTSGGVTDFSDYSTTTGKWGNPAGLYGPIYAYKGPSSSMTAKVETTGEKTLHATGAVAAGDYAGAGVSFAACATVAEFTKVQFTISGSIGDCVLELQIKTFDQTPTTGDPPGSCDSNTTSCYGFPVFKQIVVPTSTATDVVKPLADFSGWSAANARQVVGLQWQLTKAPATDPDAGTSCAVDIQVDNIKFLP